VRGELERFSAPAVFSTDIQDTAEWTKTAIRTWFTSKFEVNFAEFGRLGF